MNHGLVLDILLSQSVIGLPLENKIEFPSFSENRQRCQTRVRSPDWTSFRVSSNHENSSAKRCRSAETLNALFVFFKRIHVDSDVYFEGFTGSVHSNNLEFFVRANAQVLDISDRGKYGELLYAPFTMRVILGLVLLIGLVQARPFKYVMYLTG